MIRPDKKSFSTFDATTLAVKPAWSPDSQSVAWVAKSADGKFTQVWTIDTTTKNRKLLFGDHLAPAQPEKSLITWSPDGTHVIFADERGQAWSIAANCTSTPIEGCASNSREQINEVPRHWLPDFYPQWAGEKVSP